MRARVWAISSQQGLFLNEPIYKAIVVDLVYTNSRCFTNNLSDAGLL